MLFCLAFVHSKPEEIRGKNDDKDVKMLFSLLDYG